MNFYVKYDELNFKEKIIICNFNKKNIQKIIIIYENNFDNIKEDKYLIFLKNEDKELQDHNKIKFYKNIFCLIKIIIKDKKLEEKLFILENLCDNLETIIINCGPSVNGLDFGYLQEIQDKYIIISVKYITNKLLENNINIDFKITSDYTTINYVINRDYDDNIITIHNCRNSIIKDKNYDIFITPNRKSRWNKTFTHLKRNNLNIIKFNNNKIKNNILHVNLAHIMLECVIPLAIHLNINKIYTCGWDGFIKKFEYFSEITKEIEEKYKNKKILFNRLEFKHIAKINKIFNINNIFLYKLNKKSPIKLPYYNLLKFNN